MASASLAGRLSSLEACGTLIGPIDAITLFFSLYIYIYRPNRHPIGCEEWSSCFWWEAHEILIGCGG